MKTSLKGFKLVVISSAVRDIRRACLAARLKLQVFLSFFFFSCVLAKRGLMILFLAETVETGDTNRDVTDNMFRPPCMFCEESLGKINVKDVFELFRNGSVTRILSLESVDYWQKWILQWSKKEESLWAKLQCPLALMTFSLPSLFLFLKSHYHGSERAQRLSSCITW